MSLCKHPTKKGHWQIRISQGRKNKPLDFVFDGDEAEAKLYELDLKRAYKPPSVNNGVIQTFNEMLPEFISYHQSVSQPSTVSSFIRSWKNLEPVFGKIRPNELNMILIQHYKKLRLTHDNHRGGTVSKRTINKEISYLSSVIRWASSEDSGNLIDPLPFRLKGFPAKQTKAPLPRILTMDEIDRLIAAVPAGIRGLTAAMYYGALRFSEAASLKTRDIDLERGIMIIRGKGDKERTVPIREELRPYLSREGDGLLFPSRNGGGKYKDIRTSLENAASRAGISKHVHPHLLRHTMGGHAINDISLRALQTIMGHSTPIVTMRYTQVNEELLKTEMQKFRRAAV